MSILQLTLPLMYLQINSWLFMPCSPCLPSEHTRMVAYSWHNHPTDSTYVTFYVTFTLRFTLHSHRFTFHSRYPSCCSKTVRRHDKNNKADSVNGAYSVLTMTLTNLTSADHGKYTCHATTTRGNVTNTLSKDITITVVDPGKCLLSCCRRVTCG